MNLTLRLANYITRYAPSRQKVTEYIVKKSKTTDPTILLASLGYNEELMIQMWMRSFVAGGKGKNEITMKLLKKGFKKQDIQNMLEIFGGELEDWSILGGHITENIDSLQSSGKSKNHIMSIVTQKYPYFRNEIKEYLEEKNDMETLEKTYEKYRQKYDLTTTDGKRKLYDALQRRGFRYKDIESLRLKDI